MPIQNQSKLDEAPINDLRAAIEHRATWFYFLVDEARKRGLDAEDFARKAIFRCGCFHGDTKFGEAGDLKEFAGRFANELTRKIFEMEIAELTDQRFAVEFHYCPLVSAWQKQGVGDPEVETLCDIAMDGDRGIVSRFPGMTMQLEETIAKGGKSCRIVISQEALPGNK